jgi:hypothetical protein
VEHTPASAIAVRHLACRVPAPHCPGVVCRSWALSHCSSNTTEHAITTPIPASPPRISLVISPLKCTTAAHELVVGCRSLDPEQSSGMWVSLFNNAPLTQDPVAVPQLMLR